jgi:hypothetical protein
MQERYRSDYDGEFVILNTSYQGGQKIQEREWVANPIENQYISSRAAIIGQGASREAFNIKHIEDHRGGLLGSKRLQTYGAEGCWQELRCDFYISLDNQELANIIEKNYVEKSTVYTRVRNLFQFPQQFYLIPYNIKLCSIATAMYIAAFDGHKELFLIGVDGTINEQANQKVIQNINQVIQTYSNTEFTFVSDQTVESVFRKNTNVKTMDYRTWISYCDV